MPGAALTIAAVDDSWGDGVSQVTIRVHTESDTYAIQLTGWPVDDAHELAAQVVAGIRLR